MTDTDATRTGGAAATTPSKAQATGPASTQTQGKAPTAANIGATGGLDLTRFQQEVAEEIGVGPDALARLNAKAQQINGLESRSHST